MNPVQNHRPNLDNNIEFIEEEDPLSVELEAMVKQGVIIRLEQKCRQMITAIGPNVYLKK